MKKLKNVWLFLSFILMVAGMASCSTEDPTGVEVSRDDIIGNWQVTANDYENVVEGEGSGNYVGQVLAVKRDGTATFLGRQYTWKLDGDTLTLSGVSDMSVKVIILKCEGGIIEAAYTCYFVSEDYMDSGHFTFKRV
ncbi:hypothetical protein [Phocaeicola plebeius]|uniref:hypothetical protein n=1 Tax=Phocaeicola plebeius TaxID=310297 RepID=UPI0026EC815E|nr:hypothetical protein [Phocaeicola plebeius]